MLTELYNLFYIDKIKTVPTDLSRPSPHSRYPLQGKGRRGKGQLPLL